MRKVSVIIPTYKRHKDILRTLVSLNAQTFPPDEVIIFDESPTDELRKILKQFKSKFILKYIWKHSRFRSLARSRNKAKKIAKGDLIVFLDDDVILDKNYLNELVTFMEKNPKVVGVTGTIINDSKYSIWYQLMNIVFMRPHKTRTPKVQRTFIPTSPYDWKTLPTEWLSGCNMAYRKEILESKDFDWKLLKYSYSEDVDYSHRIHKKFGKGSLWVIGSAKLVHNHSPKGRLLRYELETHRRVINLYMLYKHFGNTKLNILVFLWWNLGEIVEYLLGGVLHRDLKNRLDNILVIVASMKFALKNLGKIRQGNILRVQQDLS